MADRIIALTGGIGSGKTLALTFLKKAGYKTISCDEITASLYKKRGIKKKIAEIFPSAAKGGIFIKLDKKVVAKEVFVNAEKRQKLNALLHPLIMGKAIEKAENIKAKAAFIEVPLLFESGSEKMFDEVVILKRNLSDRIESVKKRSLLTEEEIKGRINAQFDYDSANTEGYTIIINDGDETKFERDVLKVAEELAKPVKK